MTTGKLPFNGTTVGHLRKLILSFKQFQAPSHMDSVVAALISCLITREPSERVKTSIIIKRSQSATDGAINQPNWAQYLIGQTFPGPLPRFAICPPMDMMESKQAILKLCDEDNEKNMGRTRRKKKKETDSLQLNRKESEELGSNSDQSPGPSIVDLAKKKHSYDLATVARAALMYHRLSIDSRSKSADRDHSNLENDNRRALMKLTVVNEQAESEAIKMLMELGISTEELVASRNLQARSAVTGAYRILLHRLHKIRKMSSITTNSEDLQVIHERVSNIPTLKEKIVERKETSTKNFSRESSIQEAPQKKSGQK
ncbi:G2-specific protein kinase nim-1, partial [Cichlidogyrus casuarinus]